MTTWRPYQLNDWLARLTARDLLILEDLERFRLLSTRHVQQLHFDDDHVSALAGTRGAIRVLGRLEGHGLIARLARRVGGAASGSSASVWQLASTGERLLRARRGESTRRRFTEPSAAFAAHTLAVSDLAVRTIVTSRIERFEIRVLETEPGSWRAFTSPSGSVVWLKPDLLAVTADLFGETHVWFEVDRGTEHLPAVLRKCAVYQRYYDAGIYQAAEAVFPLIVWSVPDESRAARLKAAIDADPLLTSDLFAATVSGRALDVLVFRDG